MVKKKVSKKIRAGKEVALTEAPLSSAALAEYANYDLKEFKGDALDIKENAELFSNDILIPKVWLVQTMSEIRKQKKAEEGQFIDSQTKELLADNEKELRFVVLKTFKRWHTFEMVGTKKEFISSEVMVLGKNHDLKYDETIEGKIIKRRQVISAYVILERDFKMKINKPYIIDFASTSKGGGRIMVSDIKTLNDRNLPSYVAFFKMTSHEEKFELGETFVKHITFGGFLPKDSMAYLKDCKNFLALNENTIEIDDADIIDESKSANKKGKKNANVNQKANSAGAGI